MTARHASRRASPVCLRGAGFADGPRGTAQRLKSAVWFAVGQMVDEESMRRGLNATPQFIGALTELVWTQIGTSDLASVLPSRIPSFPDVMCKRAMHEGKKPPPPSSTLPRKNKKRKQTRGKGLADRRGDREGGPENVATDLESFSSHAGRSTVTTADVLLLARKNPDLQQLMQAFVDDRKATAAAAAGTGGRGKGKARRGGGA